VRSYTRGFGRELDLKKGGTAPFKSKKKKRWEHLESVCQKIFKGGNSKEPELKKRRHFFRQCRTGKVVIRKTRQARKEPEREDKREIATIPRGVGVQRS